MENEKKGEEEIIKKEKTLKELDQAWDNVNEVQQKQLSPEKEVIETYLSLVDFLKFTPMEKPEWRASWDYIDDFSEKLPEQHKDIYRFTRTYCNTIYGEHEVTKEDLEVFRSSCKKLFKSVRAQI